MELTSVDSVVGIVPLSLAFHTNKSRARASLHTLFMHRLSRIQKAATNNNQGYCLNNPCSTSTLNKIEFDLYSIFEIFVLFSVFNKKLFE